MNIQEAIEEEIKQERKAIEMNMLRDRCEKFPDITQEMWVKMEVDSENKELLEEFLLESTQLSPKSLKQYTSSLRIFMKWLMDTLNNKKFYTLKKKDFLRYQNFLIRHGLSSSGIKLKRASVSSMCNYYENYYVGEDSRFDLFRNFVKGVENVAPNSVYIKVEVTEDEYTLMKDTLLEEGRLRDYALLVTAMECGMRGGELRNMKRVEASKTIQEGNTFVTTDVILGKGRNGGKPLEYMMNQTTLDALKLYNDSRKEADNSEYMFSTYYGEKYNQLSETYFESVCKEYLSDIVGRRINEHIFRSSCASRALKRGVPEILVSKYILHHNDLSTLKFYDLRTFDEEKNQIFGEIQNKDNSNLPSAESQSSSFGNKGF